MNEIKTALDRFQAYCASKGIPEKSSLAHIHKIDQFEEHERKELRAAYEALQKENERLKVDLYGMKEAKKAQFNISKANQEESRKLLNEAFDDNVMKQQTIISLKYEIDGMQDLNATQAKRIEEHLELIEATAEFSKAFWEKADKHSDTRVMVSTFQQLERKLRTYLPASKNGE